LALSKASLPAEPTPPAPINLPTPSVFPAAACASAAALENSSSCFLLKSTLLTKFCSPVTVPVIKEPT
jgi:hypothetical protein